MGTFQHAAGAVPVLDVGGVNFDGQKAAVGIGHGVPFAAMDALSGVVAFESPFCFAVLTNWLSSTAALGEASRPAGSQSSCM